MYRSRRRPTVTGIRGKDQDKSIAKEESISEEKDIRRRKKMQSAMAPSLLEIQYRFHDMTPIDLTGR